MNRLLFLITILSAFACHAQFATYNSLFDVPYSAVKEVEYLMPNEIKDYNWWKEHNPDMADEDCLLYINAARAQDNLIAAPATIVDFHFGIVEDGDEINVPDAAGAANLSVEIINSTVKTIKEITLRFEFTDAYGQQLYDIRTGDRYCVLTFNNLPGRTDSDQYDEIAKTIMKTYNMLDITKASYRKLFFNSKASNVRLHDVRILYNDGSKSNKVALFSSVRGNAVDLLKYGPLAPAVQFVHGQKGASEDDTRMTEGKSQSSTVYRSVEQMPKFPGGEAALMKYVQSHRRFPAETDSSGRVVVQFVVQRDGSIGEVKVVKSVDPYLDEEAVRVVKSLPDFVPGRQNGQPVNVWYTLPISF